MHLIRAEPTPSRVGVVAAELAADGLSDRKGALLTEVLGSADRAMTIAQLTNITQTPNWANRVMASLAVIVCRPTSHRAAGKHLRPRVAANEWGRGQSTDLHSRYESAS